MGGSLFTQAYVLNLLNTAPGILELPIADRPAFALTGTLFIATDTLLLQRFNGVSWDTISGGGGGTPTWQATMNVAGGNVLTNENDIDMGGFTFYMYNPDVFEIDGQSGSMLRMTNAGSTFASGTETMELTGTALSAEFFQSVIIASDFNSVSISSGTDVDITAENGVIDIVNTAGSSHLLLASSGYVELLSGTTSSQILLQSSALMQLINTGSNITMGAASGTTSIYNASGFIDIVAGANLDLSSSTTMLFSSGTEIQLNASGGDIDLFSSAAITLNATTSVNAAVDFQADGGITIPVGEIIRFPTASAATGVVPAVWIDVMIGGVAYKIPGYTP
jgi:hypothetical protein